MLAEEKSRLVYMDSMRGMMMLLVIYSHIFYFSLKCDTFLYNVFLSFRMPAFFFVSGFFSYKNLGTVSGGRILLMINKKIKGQLVPTLVVSAIYLLVSGISYLDFMFDDAKTGYWFPIVLFEVFVVYYSLIYFFGKMRENVVFCLIFIVSTLLYFSRVFLHGDVVDFFSLDKFCCYFVFFVLGAFVRSKERVFNKLVVNKYISAICFVLFFTSFFPPVEVIPLPILNLIRRFTGLFIVYLIFYTYRDYWASNAKVSRFLSYVGKNTLEIYLLHYFFLFSLSPLRIFVKYDPHNILLEFVVIFSLSVLIACSCLICKKIINVSPVLSTLMFGPSK